MAIHKIMDNKGFLKKHFEHPPKPETEEKKKEEKEDQEGKKGGDVISLNEKRDEKAGFPKGTHDQVREDMKKAREVAKRLLEEDQEPVTGPLNQEKEE